MLRAYMSDVGDGLCLATEDESRKAAQIDCGSTVGYWNHDCGKAAFEGLMRILQMSFIPETLFLSHFHLDHYCGLAYGAAHASGRTPNVVIKRVVTAGVPQFPQSTQFFHAMNLRLLGDSTGVQGYDLLRLVRRLNRGLSPAFQMVFQGDTIKVDGGSFNVLWPPRLVGPNTYIAKVAARAVELFEMAKNEDKPTKRWYEYVREHQQFPDQRDENNWELDQGQEDFALPDFDVRRLPPIVEQANWALRKAANRISLCFRDSQHDLLFFGDVNKKEIDLIVNSLLQSNCSTYGLLVTPHHGTRWSNAFLATRCEYALSSCGQRLFMSLQNEFKEISGSHHVTWINGNLSFAKQSGIWHHFP